MPGALGRSFLEDVVLQCPRACQRTGGVPGVAKEVKLGEVGGSQAVKSLITQLQNLDFYQAQGTTGG